MIYSGLENDYYLVDNPIYLKIQEESTPYQNPLLNISIGSYVFDAQMHNGEVIIDLSPIIKYLMTVPNFFNQSNIVQLSATILEEGSLPDFIFFEKHFIRGGRYTGANNYLTNGTILKPAEKIPEWPGYPTRKYTINGSQIVESLPSNGDIEQMTKRSCKGIYIKFLNSLGGYSDYLFENFTIRKSGNQGDVIKNYNRNNSFPGGIDFQNNFTQLSANGEYEITAEARIDQRHYNIIRDLVHSSEVLVYNFGDLIDSDYNQTWTKLINPGNSISINSEDETTDVALTFNTMFTKDNSVNA